MKEKESALYSHYIIDGVKLDTTPADLLNECMEFPDFEDDESDEYDDIIDESTDAPIITPDIKDEEFETSLQQMLTIADSERPFSLLYPSHFTKLQISKALLSRLWSEGHFRLYNLRLWAQWDWNTRPIGNMASFYKSAETAGEYIFGLGVKMSDYLFIENDERCSAKFFAWLPEDDLELESETNEQTSVPEISLFKSPYESNHPWIGEKRRCSSVIHQDKNSWIIYIPFDTCPFRLGGSLLEQSNGRNGGLSPNIQDPDYFIDCYEVVRELVEDGIIMAGQTVADGGLALAAAKMCGNYGIDMNISGIASSYNESNSMAILFGETPGVLIQVSDSDYDYLDSQLILQDIAYYPIGHPSNKSGLNIEKTTKNGVAGILASLLGQAEGED